MTSKFSCRNSRIHISTGLLLQYLLRSPSYSVESGRHTSTPNSSINPPGSTTRPCSIPTHDCSVCGESFVASWRLEYHAANSKHKTFRCDIAGCHDGFIKPVQLRNHQRFGHGPDHRRSDTVDSLTCVECNASFTNNAKLELHANSHQHSPFACICGIRFARIDVLYRHIDSFGLEMPKFPCAYCKRHRGKNGFRRRDHLVQHLRGYHKFDSEQVEDACPKAQTKKVREILACPWESCDAYRDDGFRSLPLLQQTQRRPFQTRTEYGKHMREVHKQTPFPCPITGCDRTKERGYMREKDLKKHISDKHPGAEEYVAQPREARETLYPCEVDGCGKVFKSSRTLYWHTCAEKLSEI